jgi:3'(2'), 5'-bisphosphate nucleotidase
VTAAPTRDELLFVRDLARRAATVVMSHYEGGYDVDKKDGEPVTVADRQSNELIVAALRERFPDDAIVAEESPNTGEAWRSAGRCWFVDPLDGTSDFVKKRVGFCVMIGLCVDGRPALGAVVVPRAGRTFLGLVGEGAEEETKDGRRALHCSERAKSSELRVIASIAHRDEVLEATLAALAPAETLSVGSVGLKVGKIAADEADLYTAPTARIHLWDTCAPEAILVAAGGAMVDFDGQPLNYRGPGFTHPRGILATNGACAEDVLERLVGKVPTF